MAPTVYQEASQTYISTNGTNVMTALQAVQGMFPGVSFQQWDSLETADVAGTGPRNLAYHKSPTVLGIPIPIVFDDLPPQAVGLRFEVPCHGRVGGVVIRYPIAVGYMDGV